MFSSPPISIPSSLLQKYKNNNKTKLKLPGITHIYNTCWTHFWEDGIDYNVFVFVFFLNGYVRTLVQCLCTFI